MIVSKANILKDLRVDILRLQGFKEKNRASIDIGLGEIAEAFPNHIFPIGAVHEFLSKQHEDMASTSGFIAGLLSSIMRNQGATLWISSSRTLFPPALKRFGVSPDHFVFLDLQKEKDVLWAMDEALKCEALSAVVGEMRDLDFKSSRRLQLAVERSQVTGFVLRKNYRTINTTACVSRWRITSLASSSSGFPGVGFPKWQVELMRMRNGKTGTWVIQWIGGRFVPVHTMPSVPITQKKAG